MRDEAPKRLSAWACWTGNWEAAKRMPSCVADIQGSTSAYKFVGWLNQPCPHTPWNGLSFVFGTWRAAADAADGRPLWKFHNGSFNNWLRGRLVFVTRNDAAPPAVWPKRFLETSENRSLSLCHKGGIFRHSCSGLERARGGVAAHVRGTN